MIERLLILSFMLMLQASAGDPPGFILWPKGIPPGGSSEKASFEGHVLSISHRDKDGLAEVHEKFVDVIVIQSGEATLVVGGKVIEPNTIEAGEIRGKSIEGGVKKKIMQGDVIHIPAGIPHQFFITAGGQITYVLVQVATQ